MNPRETQEEYFDISLEDVAVKPSTEKNDPVDLTQKYNILTKSLLENAPTNKFNPIYIDQTINDYETILKSSHESHITALCYIQLGSAYENKVALSNSFDDKKNCYYKAMNHYESAANLNYFLAKEKLLILYKELIKLNLINRYNFDDKVSHYEKEIKQFKQDIGSKTKKSTISHALENGNAYYLEGYFKTALFIYNKIIENEPNVSFKIDLRRNDSLENYALEYLSNVRFMRGKANAKLEKYKEAIQDFNHVIDRNPSAMVYFNRGLTHKSYVSHPHFNYLLDDIPKCEAAITDLSKTLELNLDLPIIHQEIYSMRLQIAETYFRHKNKKEAYRSQAISKYRDLIKQYPHNTKIANWLYEIANVYSFESNFIAAIACYTEILENYRPKNGNIHFNRAICHKIMGNNKAALDDFIKAYEYSPQTITRTRHYKDFILNTIVDEFAGEERIKLLKEYTNENTTLGKIACTAREERKCDKSRGYLKGAHKYLVFFENENNNPQVAIKNSKHMTLGFIKQKEFEIQDEDFNELKPLTSNLKP